MAAPEPFHIRPATPADARRLADIERRSPEGGRFALRIDPRVDHSGLVGRYPGVRGHVAVGARSGAVLGMLFSSVAPTRLNGAVVPDADLYCLRVDPAARRRGVAVALIGEATSAARAQDGAAAAWAAVVEGNTASLRAFARAGFAPAAELVGRAVPAAWALATTPRPTAARPVRPGDLPDLVALLNRAHRDHNLWRPTAGERLAAELCGPDHGLEDAAVVEAGGGLVAAGAGFDLARVARLRPLPPGVLPPALRRLLEPLVGLVPAQPLLLRHRALPPDRPAEAEAVLRALLRRAHPLWAALAVTLDRRDEAWPIVARLPGPTARVVVVARSDEPFDPARALYLG